MQTESKKPRIHYGMTRNEIAAALVVDYKVFMRFLREIGIEHSYKLRPIEIELIRVKWGVDYM